MSDVVFSGQEPGLGDGVYTSTSRHAPMLGGRRRQRINRELFWRLLDIDFDVRYPAIRRVLDQGAGRYYGTAMLAVLSPQARYYRLGRIWKVPYTTDHKLAAMDTLRRIAPEQAVSGMARALTNADPVIQQTAIAHLGELSAPDAERALLAILRDHRLFLRRAALRTLAQRWDMGQLLWLNTNHPALMARTIRELAGQGDARIVPVLCGLLTLLPDTPHDLLWAAIVEGLRALVDDASEDARAEVVATLAQMLAGQGLPPARRTMLLDVLYHIGTEDAQAVAIVHEAQQRATMWQPEGPVRDAE